MPHSGADYQSILDASRALKNKLRGLNTDPLDHEAECKEGKDQVNAENKNAMDTGENRAARDLAILDAETVFDTNQARTINICPASSFPEFYELRTEGSVAGYGAFATNTIRMGTRILDERPILMDFSPTMFASPSIIADMFGLDLAESKCFAHLPACPRIVARYRKAAQRVLADDKALTSCEPTPELMMENTMNEVLTFLLGQGPNTNRSYEANRIQLDYHIVYLSKFERNALLLERHERGGKAIFNEASRFNHSCRPNAIQAWNKGTGRLTIHTLRAIDKHEEITLNYCPETRYNWEARRAWLQYHYSFHCKCSACEGPTAALSRSRREHLSELCKTVNSWYKPKGEHTKRTRTPRHIRKAMSKFLKIHILEGLVSPETARLYTIKAIIAAEFGVDQDVIRYKQDAYEILVRCYGFDNTIVTRGREELNELWANRDDMSAMLNILWEYCAVNAPPTNGLSPGRILRVDDFAEDAVKNESDDRKESLVSKLKVTNFACIMLAKTCLPFKQVKTPLKPESRTESPGDLPVRTLPALPASGRTFEDTSQVDPAPTSVFTFSNAPTTSLQRKRKASEEKERELSDHDSPALGSERPPPVPMKGRALESDVEAMVSPLSVTPNGLRICPKEKPTQVIPKQRSHDHPYYPDNTAEAFINPRTAPLTPTEAQTVDEKAKQDAITVYSKIPVMGTNAVLSSGPAKQVTIRSHKGVPDAIQYKGRIFLPLVRDSICQTDSNPRLETPC